MRFLAIAAAVLVCVPAIAQLSDQDIARLQEKGRAEGWTFAVGPTPATRAPAGQLHGLRIPPDWRKKARFQTFSGKANLPPQFSWRDIGSGPPVKNQGGCGSCWAFATTGAIEWAIRIKDGTVEDLSEQWLVSCNVETEPPPAKGAWGCGPGGYWAFDYFTGAKADPCGDAGAVMTVDFPYMASDVPCNCPYHHEYGIDSWAYIAGELDIPTPEAIKEAIHTYGPVVVAVYADNAFQAYQGGVFNASNLQEVNHAVVLVGWDDTQGANGVWIARNSWSNAWGEQGHMRIEYGCSNVGFGAAFIQYAGKGLGFGPTITIQPKDTLAVPGLSASLRVEANGIGELHYQWQKGENAISADTPVLVLAPVKNEDFGSYTCRVADVRGETTSRVAELRMAPPGTLPTNGTLCLGLLMFVIGLLLVMPVSCRTRESSGSLLRRK